MQPAINYRLRTFSIILLLVFAVPFTCPAPQGVPPVILTQPASLTVVQGTSAAFTVDVTSTGSKAAYQWKLAEVAIAGATKSSYSISSAQASDAGTYNVVVTNTAGSVTSSNAVLTVQYPLSLTQQPHSQSVAQFGSLDLTVAATGTAPIAYQWFFNGMPLAGGTASKFSLSNFQASEAGAYKVSVSNLVSVVSSSNTVLTIGVPVAGVATWGANTAGEGVTPKGLGNVIAVSGGQKHNVALLSGGSVYAWGDNTYAQTNVPGSASNVLSIVAGAFHTLAVRQDGTVVAWGDNRYGQCSIPSGLTKVAAVAAGQYHSLALKTDGTVVAWGAGSVVNATNHIDLGQSMVPSGLLGVVQISAGYRHSVALRADGTIAAWGDNTYGQTNLPSGLTNIVKIAAGAYHTLAVKTNGTVRAWGAGTNSTPSDQINYGQSIVPTGLSNVVSVAGGLSASAALAGDGSLVAWGNTNNAQTTIPPGLAKMVSVAMGGGQVLALQGSGAPVITVPPFSQTAKPSNSVSFTVMAVGDARLSYQWRFNDLNILRATNSSYTISSAQATNAGNYNVLVSNMVGSVTSSNANLTMQASPPSITQQPLSQTINQSASVNLTVAAAGTPPLAYQWFFNGAPVSGGTSSILALSNIQAGQAGVYQVTVSNLVSVVTSSNAALTVVIPVAGVATWGANSAGQGVTPADLSGVRAVSAGQQHNVAVRSNGLVYAWGDNTYGQTNVPRAASNIVSIAAGAFHTLAIRQDGTVIAWGDNRYSQCLVPTGLTAVGVAAGEYHSLALKADGTVVAWGRGSTLNATNHIDYGQSRIPTGLAGVVQIAAGYLHSVALKSDRTVVAWGDNTYGQVTLPTSLTNIAQIAAGGYHTLALRTNGTVTAWGAGTVANPSDQVDYGQSLVPAGLSNIVSVAGGLFASAALTSNGSIVAWGKSDSGQTTVPPGLAKAISVALGGGQMLALQGSGLPAIKVPPFSQAVNSGNSVVLNVMAVGDATLKYKWQYNGSAINGATTASYRIANFRTQVAGNYNVFVYNSIGQVLSPNAILSVNQTNVSPSALIQGLFDSHGYKFHVKGPPGQYIIQASTDLVNWTNLSTHDDDTGDFDFTDADAVKTPKRYYRTIQK